MHKPLTQLKYLLVAVILMASLPSYADWQAANDSLQAGDYATAFKEIKPLAEQGNALAQFNLGLMYDNGEGAPQDDKEAAKWWRLAAEQGHVWAQYNLGVIYVSEEGVPQDYKEAVKWFRLSAEQGAAPAQYSLGVRYAKGEGVPQDYVECYSWNSIAAASGHDDAKHNRDICAEKLSPEALSKAQEKAAEYWEKYGNQ